MSILMATLFGIKPKLTGIVDIHCSEDKDDIDPEFAHPELSDADFSAINNGKKKRNRTEKADGRYLDALQNGNLTTNEIAKAIKRSPNSVQKHMRKMEARGLVKIIDIIPNGAYPAFLWGMK